MGAPQAQTFGPFTLVEQLAVGGMAEIYLAKTRGLAGFEKYLALKLIHPDFADDEQFVQMLIDEAKIAVGLSHPNIAQVFDLGREEGRYFISMEYVRGADLFQIMRKLTDAEIEVPVEVAVYLVQELCAGLSYVHDKRDAEGRPLKIIHRDISPQNIMVSQAGEVKLVDFGIAMMASRHRRTQAGFVKGKYYYMSPEQVRGGPVDQRSDIFSAGIILYEVLVGQMLYLEEDVDRLVEKVRQADIAPPATRRPEIPPALSHIAMRALAKDPDQRFDSAEEFRRELSTFLVSNAPDFTPDRLGDLVGLALSQKAATAPDRSRSFRMAANELMSRAEFGPMSESVLHPLPPEAQPEDLDEATIVSGPPNQMARLVVGDERARWEEVAAEPTVVSKIPGRELDSPQSGGRPVSNRAAQELVVPSKALERSPSPVELSDPDRTWALAADQASAAVDGRAEFSPSTTDIGRAHTIAIDANSALIESTSALESDGDTAVGPVGHDWHTARTAVAVEDSLAADTATDLTAPAQSLSPRRRLVRIAVIAAGMLCLAAIFFALGPAKSARQGEIDVWSVPSGAEVWLNGRRLKSHTRTSVKVADRSLKHSLEVRRPGFQPWTSEVRFVVGQAKVRVIAVLEAEHGTIKVDSRPTGADIYINGAHRGKTPAVVGGLPVNQTIRLELRKRGFRPETRTLLWGGTRQIETAVRLKRSPD